MIAQDPVANADFVEHKDFYRRFIRFVILSVGTIATVLILMAYFLT